MTKTHLTGMPSTSKPAGDFSPLRVVCLSVQFRLSELMQAALVRNVSFAVFAGNPRGFRTHPSASLTWRALEALEGTCVVHIVECLRNPFYKPHVPASVEEKLKRLEGHRDVVSHPFLTKKEDWTHARMKRFEAEERRYESRVPLVWDLQQAINAELADEGNEPLTDFYVTNEMAQQLRQIWTASMRPINIPNIPHDADLVALLQGCRDKTLQSCQDRADGKPAPPVQETELDRIWAAQLRGEKVSWPADND